MLEEPKLIFLQATGLGDDFEDNHDARRKDYDNNGECCLNDNNSEEEKTFLTVLTMIFRNNPGKGQTGSGIYTSNGVPSTDASYIV